MCTMMDHGGLLAIDIESRTALFLTTFVELDFFFAAFFRSQPFFRKSKLGACFFVQRVLLEECLDDVHVLLFKVYEFVGNNSLYGLHGILVVEVHDAECFLDADAIRNYVRIVTPQKVGTDFSREVVSVRRIVLFIITEIK